MTVTKKKLGKLFHKKNISVRNKKNKQIRKHGKSKRKHNKIKELHRKTLKIKSNINLELIHI